MSDKAKWREAMSDKDIAINTSDSIAVEDSDVIAFRIGDNEVMRIDADGRFFVADEEVTGSVEIRDLFADWVRGMRAAYDAPCTVGRSGPVN